MKVITDCEQEVAGREEIFMRTVSNDICRLLSIDSDQLLVVGLFVSKTFCSVDLNGFYLIHSQRRRACRFGAWERACAAKYPRICRLYRPALTGSSCTNATKGGSAFLFL